MNSIQIPARYYGYNHTLPFDWQEVVRLEGMRNYTVFVLKDGKKHISTKTIGNYEAFLPTYFLRVHKQCIVNMASIQAVCRATKTIVLSDGFVHAIARRRWAELKIYV
jgi:DNA-binding LytR/AlgR family response regulator